ncbi:hypothetical protein V6N13_075087 [Hibiscus sabdariffa]|uniref:Uncharacterized protein n=1 Tax=Hibiscus sabdariffa TaxID=183260 RepID=A0ABR2UAF0_9ROSI
MSKLKSLTRLGSVKVVLSRIGQTHKWVHRLDSLSLVHRLASPLGWPPVDLSLYLFPGLHTRASPTGPTLIALNCNKGLGFLNPRRRRQRQNTRARGWGKPRERQCNRWQRQLSNQKSNNEQGKTKHDKDLPTTTTEEKDSKVTMKLGNLKEI